MDTEEFWINYIVVNNFSSKYICSTENRVTVPHFVANINISGAALAPCFFLGC
ncbi:hypothetical protein JHK84_038877 [Glycine max]|nr:hypothetical protein JHK84_038877 [Glycine max]